MADMDKFYDDLIIINLYNKVKWIKVLYFINWQGNVNIYKNLAQFEKRILSLNSKFS